MLRSGERDDEVPLICTNGHPAPDDVTYCAQCGVNTFVNSPAAPVMVIPVQYVVAPPRKVTNGMAIASMVLGIVWLYGIGSILALIFGLVARKQISERNEAGEPFAIAGITLGIVGIVGVIVYFLLFAWIFGSMVIHVPHQPTTSVPILPAMIHVGP